MDAEIVPTPSGAIATIGVEQSFDTHLLIRDAAAHDLNGMQTRFYGMVGSHGVTTARLK